MLQLTQYAAGRPARADTLRVSRLLYRSLHSPGNHDRTWSSEALDLSFRIKDAIARDVADEALSEDRDRLVSLLIPLREPTPPPTTPTVIRSSNPFDDPPSDPPAQRMTVERLREEALRAARQGTSRAL